MAGRRFNEEILANQLRQDSPFQTELIDRLLTQNDQMQKSIRDLATSVATSLSNLANSFVPILETKDKEN